MRRILLVAPDKHLKHLRAPDFGSESTGVMPPVELATIAALTPPEFEVDVWDEGVKGLIDPSTDLGKEYHLGGVTGYLAHIPRMLDLGREFQRRGMIAVAGGPAVSGTPERFRGIFDTIFVGEAELTWPQFLEEWQSDRQQNEYRQVQRPDITLSPRPKWDSLPDIPRDYIMGPVQTTRGCPFDCEFCDVIHLFGRQPRHKKVETVMEEIAALERLGVKRIFFCDDDFIGRPKYTRELLEALVPLNHSFDVPIGFFTQLTITLARHEDILKLMADANFWQLHVGIESPRKASLLEVNKHQNTKGDLVEDVRQIQSYGIMVKALMIVGFDNDDTAIFDETHEFLQEACTPLANISPLSAWPGTPLHARLLREGRVLDVDLDYLASNLQSAITNVVPGGMSRVELFEGLLRIEELHRAWPAFGDRMKGFIRGVKHAPEHAQRTPPPDADRVAAFQQLIAKLDDEARGVVLEIIGETMKHAPWLLRNVASKIVYHVGLAAALPKLRERYLARIEMELAEGYSHRILRMRPPIPLGFKRVYRDVFADSYRQVLEGIADSRVVAEGLIRVWKGFMIRWGETFEKFEDYHHEHIRELCNRTIEQGNDGQFSDSRVNAEVNGLTGVQIRRLADEVLFCVEQDLRGASPEAGVDVNVDGQPTPGS